MLILEVLVFTFSDTKQFERSLIPSCDVINVIDTSALKDKLFHTKLCKQVVDKYMVVKKFEVLSTGNTVDDMACKYDYYRSRSESVSQ